MIRSAMIAALLAGAPVAAQTVGDDACDSGRGPAVLVEIDGLASRQGLIRAELFPATKEDWLRDDVELEREGKPFRRVEARLPASGPVRLCLRAPAAGRYAIGVFHATDGVRKFNVRKHGVGFANNPRIGWSQPDVTKATVTVGPGVAEVPVLMNYLRGLAMRPLPYPPREPEPRFADQRPR